MTEDVYEPLESYRDEFKEKFARLTRERFEALTAESGVDVEANRKLVKEIAALKGEESSLRFKKGLCLILMVLCFIAAVVLGVVAYMGRADGRTACVSNGALAAGALALGLLLIPPYRRAAARIAELQRRIEEKTAAAWEQMEPLNRLYTWDVTTRLIEATVPRIDFDPYFAAARLDALRRQFDWDDSFNEGKSIVFAQSGVINGNPFVFGQYLEMEWGEKTYEGVLEISWTDIERGPDGKARPVRKHDTLRATVTKPIPVYNERKVLVYGNDAAPNLSFSRKPSGFKADGGFFEKLKQRRRLKDLQAYSRILTDASEFTLMGNEEFETWFNAKNRDNEVEFRVLFTPVAQRQMLALMQDVSVGYGDDFSFAKRRKINFLHARHLNEATIETDPARFRNWNYDAAKAEFQSFNERYFKDAYFSLAPFLAIPSYQQVRTHEEIWKDVVAPPASSFWEHESLANYHGEDRFRHPESVTRNILKTRVVSESDVERTVAVTAYGYKAVDRVDVQEVYGGDGDWHDVEIPWVEYVPVQRTRDIGLTERPEPSDDFRRRAAAAESSAFRRSIRSFLG